MFPLTYLDIVPIHCKLNFSDSSFFCSTISNYFSKLRSELLIGYAVYTESLGETGFRPTWVKSYADFDTIYDYLSVFSFRFGCTKSLIES